MIIRVNPDKMNAKSLSVAKLWQDFYIATFLHFNKKTTVEPHNNAPKSSEKSRNSEFCLSPLKFFSFAFYIGKNRFWQYGTIMLGPLKSVIARFYCIWTQPENTTIDVVQYTYCCWHPFYHYHPPHNYQNHHYHYHHHQNLHLYYNHRNHDHSFIGLINAEF